MHTVFAESACAIWDHSEIKCINMRNHYNNATCDIKKGSLSAIAHNNLCMYHPSKQNDQRKAAY